jgi:hydroxyacylglutathione hydrolase
VLIEPEEATPMILESRAAAPFYKNGFLLACDETRDAVIIDPGDEVDELLDIAHRRQLTIRFLLLTHAHMDHLSGLARAAQSTGARIGLHQNDLRLYDGAVQQGRAFGYRVDPPPPPDFFYDLASPITFGTCILRVHHTPGHSPGGVCLEVPPDGNGVRRLFVGDTLFKGSIGRTDFPGGDYDTLIRSIRTTLFALGDSAVVFPGHGPETTIGEERVSNPFLIE